MQRMVCTGPRHARATQQQLGSLSMSLRSVTGPAFAMPSFCPLSCGTPKSPGRELPRTSQLLSAEHLRAVCGNKCASGKHSFSDENRLRKLKQWGVLYASISVNVLKTHSFRIM